MLGVAVVTFIDEKDATIQDPVDLPNLCSTVTPHQMQPETVSTQVLEQAQIPPGTSAQATLEMIEEYRESLIILPRRARRQARRRLNRYM